MQRINEKSEKMQREIGTLNDAIAKLKLTLKHQHEDFQLGQN